MSDNLMAGMVTRGQLLETEPFKGLSIRTIIRYEEQGLPVIRRGRLRIYDVEAARAWLRGERRPRSRSAAA